MKDHNNKLILRSFFVDKDVYSRFMRKAKKKKKTASSVIRGLMLSWIGEGDTIEQK